MYVSVVSFVQDPTWVSVYLEGVELREATLFGGKLSRFYNIDFVVKGEGGFPSDFKGSDYRELLALEQNGAFKRAKSGMLPIQLLLIH